MTYEFNDRIFSIEEPSLDLHLRGSPQGLKTQKVFYENGVLRSECYYCNGRLHGPSRFFTENGTLLSETWFWNGDRVGIARFFYSTGALYAILRFIRGQKCGRQEYFYENQMIKTVEEYLDGALHGESILYWPNGQMKRRSYFGHGQRIQTDQFWDEEGRLLQLENHANIS